MSTRYLKQVIVLDKLLGMSAGKAAAIAAHAAMTFLLKRYKDRAANTYDFPDWAIADLSPEQHRWISELDPGLEHLGQISMAKIVCQVSGQDELCAVQKAAEAAGLEVHRVVDSGFSHNKPGTFAGIAIGPAWPEQLDPITKHLKLYK